MYIKFSDGNVYTFGIINCAEYEEKKKLVYLDNILNRDMRALCHKHDW